MYSKSILHWLSKVFERAVALRVTDFANEFSLISSRQFGFGPGRSTVDAVSMLK